MPDPTDPGPTAPDLDASALPEGQRLLLERAAEGLPARAQAVLAKPSHRALGRVVRDAVLLLLLGDGPHGQSEQGLLEVADQALDALAELQNPSGTFRGGDNLDSPPDSAFTLNDLGWARTAPGAPESLLPALDRLLLAATPALLTGGVHTPNHRWEIASALSRLWEAHGDQATRSRAEQWLAEGVDLQEDGMFSERSANYAAHVSIPALWTMGRVLSRPDLQDAADRATRRQASLTDDRGMVETLASRRQDQFALFDGGALHPWFRAHAARTGDPWTARAALRTSTRADADAVMTLLALAAEQPDALSALPASAPEAVPSAPEVIELATSGLVTADHGTSRTVLHGGTDTAALGRVTSGSASRPVLARFRGRELGMRELRLSRDFFSLGPLRPGAPQRVESVSEDDGPAGGTGDAPGGGTPLDAAPLRYLLTEEVGAEYFGPLESADRAPSGEYPLEFNGRFAAAMAFSRRPTQRVSLSTALHVELEADELLLRWQFEGPVVPLCLLLALDGGDLDSDPDPAPRRDAQRRSVLEPASGIAGADAGERSARCMLSGAEERIEITASGALGGRAFYDPGEAYAFLGATDEPGGEVLLIPASSSDPLTLHLRRRDLHI